MPDELLVDAVVGVGGVGVDEVGRGARIFQRHAVGHAAQCVAAEVAARQILVVGDGGVLVGGHPGRDHVVHRAVGGLPGVAGQPIGGAGGVLGGHRLGQPSDRAFLEHFVGDAFGPGAGGVGALGEDRGQQHAERLAAFLGVGHRGEQLGGAGGIAGGDAADHADHPRVAALAVVVLVGPLDRGFRVVAGPGGEDAVAGEGVAGVGLGVFEGLQRVALGPGAEQHRVFAHPRVGDAEGAEGGDDRFEVAGFDGIDEFEPGAGPFDRVGGAHEFLHPGEDGVAAARPFFRAAACGRAAGGLGRGFGRAAAATGGSFGRQGAVRHGGVGGRSGGAHAAGHEGRGGGDDEGPGEGEAEVFGAHGGISG